MSRNIWPLTALACVAMGSSTLPVQADTVPPDTATPVASPAVDGRVALAEQVARATVAPGATNAAAAMTQVDYATFTAKLENDVQRATPLLAADQKVVVVAVEGPVDTRSIKWFKGPIPTTRGAIVAVDSTGRVLSRLVLFEKAQSVSARSAGAAQQSPLEMLAEVGPVTPLDI